MKYTKRLSYLILLCLLTSTSAALAVKNEGEFGPMWSPNGRFITYHKNSNTITWEIMMKDVETGEVVQLTKNNAYDTGASWSPDSKHIVFSSSVSGNRDIYKYSLDSGKSELLISHPSMDNQAIWSPSGDKVAFLSRRSGTSQVYLFDLSTRDITQLTNEPNDVFHPSWARDGKSIYFDRNSGQGSRIYRVMLDSLKVEEVYSNAGSVISAAPFKDGLIVTSNINGDWDIFEVKLESPSLLPIVSGRGHQMKGVWSEKTQQIAYSEQDGDGIWRIKTKPIK